MSAPTDICADCGHARAHHGRIASGQGGPVTGVVVLSCRHATDGHYCTCPAFDEGAPKLEPNHDALTARIADVIRRSGVPDAEQIVRAVEVRASVTKAERDVVEAAKVWIELPSGSTVEVLASAASKVGDALMRLRAIRETSERETCGASPRLPYSGLPGVTVEDEQDQAVVRPVRCTLHRNHDGRHSGPLGEWEWE